ncbi:MAG: hypothetical protein HZA81_02330 [Candidatus Taylorbacteria bacterium]|nr:hypothetical protein [Candidatus Taylorbacteria bacterium]
MIRKESLPAYVQLTENHTSVKGKVTGIRYHELDCFVVTGFVVIDETDFVSVVDSAGNETCLPAVIVEKAEVCPWRLALAV